MKVGLMVPQGWKGEYDGWDPAKAWARTVELAREAEELGFESLWAFDHFHTVPEPTDEMTFESYSVLTALAMVTRRVRLGHMVVCTGFRNPAVTAKMSSTIDVISGGRFELGIGAGWKEEEWRAYGYGFPTIGERLAALRDHLEVIVRMLEPGRATYHGEYATVSGAINQPKGLQTPRLPIIVGGNGQNVTFRIAVRFADELNLVYVGPERTAELMAVARQRCEEAGRDPATLKISLYTSDDHIREAGQPTVDLIAALQELGLSRAICFPGRWSTESDAQARFAEDCRAARVEMTEPTAAVR
jgi:F420-dependent oxidoreductase-like protein